MSIQQLAHTELRVDDVAGCLDFHTDVLGLVEVSRNDGTTYLGCGLDDGYDLAITAGGTGVAHMAFDVTGEDDLELYRERLERAGITTETLTDAEPGERKALRFRAPSGHVMELVVLNTARSYVQAGAAPHPRVHGVAPVDLDHISLMTADVRGLVDFLQQLLDFRVSDVFQPAPDVWGAAWTRVGEYHHDVAMIGADDGDATLHHLAFGMESMDHIKRGLDYLAQHGLPVEAGPGRHGVGSNVFAYFRAPGGNRYEFSAEMPRVTNPQAGPGIWSELFPKGFSAWGQGPPDSFREGS